MKIATTFKYENVQIYKFGSQPFGKPRMFSHAYFIDGLLIDTGHSNMRKAVQAAIFSLSVDQVFITHHHEDHTGNLLPVQKHFECPVYASPECVEIMKNPPEISFAQWLIWGKTDPNTSIQAKLDMIKTPHYNFEIIPVPGHAVDMVCLYEKKEGWLFSADLWVSEYIKYFMRSESMMQQIASIKKVLALDFEIMFCGHNPQFKNVKTRLTNKLQFFEDFYGKVADFYQQGNTIDAIFKQMKLKESWLIRILSAGELSTLNMVASVIRDEKTKQVKEKL